MTTYSPNMFVTPLNAFGYVGSRAQDFYVVDSCENIAGRTHTILFCTNIVSGEKREFSAGAVDTVLPELVKSQLEKEIKNTKQMLDNMTQNMSRFQEIG